MKPINGDDMVSARKFNHATKNNLNRGYEKAITEQSRMYCCQQSYPDFTVKQPNSEEPDRSVKVGEPRVERGQEVIL